MEENRLLDAIGWPSDGYRLFDIGSLHKREDEWLSLESESNFTLVRRSTFLSLRGFDEGFRSPGGDLSAISRRDQAADRMPPPSGKKTAGPV